MNFDEFNRIFCKGIFKEALMNVNENFDQQKSSQKGEESV
jgi:hypothetical protein